jgi:hypothetical protein
MNQKLIDEIRIDLDSMSIITSDFDSLLKEVGDDSPTNIHKTGRL